MLPAGQSRHRNVKRCELTAHMAVKSQRVKNSPPLALVDVLLEHRHELGHAELVALGGQEFLRRAAAA